MLLHNPTVTGSLTLSGSFYSTETLQITASQAVSASYAISASHEITKEISSSHADTADTASYIEGANVDGLVTSASYAITASYAENAGGGGGAGFPFSGSAVITGSLVVTEDITAASITETSALRYKEQVTNLESSNYIYKLRPVRFNWKQNNSPDIGLIAEEVKNIYPELVGVDKSGKAEGIKYSKLTSILIKAVQDQQTQIDELKSTIENLKQS
jgi:hypothetical protein